MTVASDIMVSSAAESPSDPEPPGLAVGLHFQATDKSVALQERIDIIAPAALGGRYENLDAIVKAEQAV